MLHDVVHRVRHAVSLDDPRRVLEKDRIGQGTRREERTAGAEDRRDLVDGHLVDQPELERLASDLAAGHFDDPVAGVTPGGRPPRRLCRWS